MEAKQPQEPFKVIPCDFDGENLDYLKTSEEEYDSIRHSSNTFI